MKPLDPQLIKQMKNMLAVTLSQAVQSVGPVPDKYDALIKETLKDDDEIGIMALGCYLEDCIKHKNYDVLENALANFEKYKVEK